MTQINEMLAELALITNSAMAVGSQFSGIENPELAKTYTVIRKINPEGIVFANLGRILLPEQAKRAIDMIGASAIQIHLNSAQEVTMPEGDRNFLAIFEILLIL